MQKEELKDGLWSAIQIRWFWAELLTGGGVKGGGLPPPPTHPPIFVFTKNGAPLFGRWWMLIKVYT